MAPRTFENRLRRIANRAGYRLVKSRARDPRDITYGRYNLINLQTGLSALSIPDPVGRGYPATIEDIAEFFDPFRGLVVDEESGDD